jgi:hypothetical protein
MQRYQSVGTPVIIIPQSKQICQTALKNLVSPYSMLKKSVDMPINLLINRELLGERYDYKLSVWFIALANIPIW